MQDAPRIGEGLVIHGDALLEGVAPRRRAGGDGVLYVVGGHELVHCGHVALGPHLLEVPAHESLVFLCGHDMPSSSSHCLPADADSFLPESMMPPTKERCELPRWPLSGII